MVGEVAIKAYSLPMECQLGKQSKNSNTLLCLNTYLCKSITIITMDVHNESASQLNVANIGYQKFNF